MEFRKNSTGYYYQQTFRKLEIDQQCTTKDETNNAASPADINVLQKYYSFNDKKHVNQVDNNTRTFHKMLDKGKKFSHNLKDTHVKKNYFKVEIPIKFKLYLLINTLVLNKYNYNKFIIKLQPKLKVFIMQLLNKKEILNIIDGKELKRKFISFSKLNIKGKLKLIRTTMMIITSIFIK